MKEPDWISDGIQLYRGDCLEILPTLTGIDAVVTDPPYGVSERTARKANGRSHVAMSYDFTPIVGDSKPFDPSPWLTFSRVILWGANHYADRLPTSPTWLVWDKRENTTSDDNADCEMAWSNIGGPARLCHHLWRGMIKASEQNCRRVHPTQKPITLMRWCIERLRLPEGATILDPYMGSGTTGIAAVQMGYSFIGIEIDPGYYAIAQRRIAEAQQQLRLL